MPEGTEESTVTETAAPEAAAPEPAAPEPSHPTGVQEEAAPEETAEQPPDLTDALTQMREHIDARLDKAGVPPAQDDSGLWDTLSGEPQAEYDEYEDDYGYEDPGQQQQQPMTEEQQVAAELDRRIEERAQAAIAPYVQHMEQERREEKVLALVDQYPGMAQPEAVQFIDNRLGALADRYGNPAIRTDPDMVQDAYFAYEARKQAGGQTSTGPAGSEQEGTAEAVGQGGATLETGAGPGAPPTEMDPQEQAYAQALNPGTKLNKFGL